MKRKYERSGPDVNDWKIGAQMANETTYNSPTFRKACQAVGIEPTKRQASKYARRFGKAFKMERMV